MTPTTKRGAVALADKTEDRIPSLAADLASLSPVARRKARKALVAIGKLAVPPLIRLLLHRKPHVRWEAAKALVRYRRSACCFCAGQCLGRPRWRRALAGGRGFGRSGPRGAATFVGGTAPAG